MYTPRLKEHYSKAVIPAMKEKFQYKNIMEIPKLVKICLNQGVGAAVADKKIADVAVEEMTIIAGQRAVRTKSKKDISNFKLRQGLPIGARVTLRSDRMYEFLDRLVSISLPRVRDFAGLNEKGFDGRGNYTLGITEQIIFPEINIDKVSKINGMDITFVTTANTDEECSMLLKEFGLPFKKTEIMAKESVKARQLKREKTVARYAVKRAALKAAGDYAALQKLPRNASPVRLKNRCKLTGRPKGYMRDFGICRNQFRQLASMGRIPGVTKSSW